MLLDEPTPTSILAMLAKPWSGPALSSTDKKDWASWWCFTISCGQANIVIGLP